MDVEDRRITASVGINGVNRQADVVTVQELLNDVPHGEGGPKPKLKVDGIAGPKTNGAIHAFQRHHFGWPGADGRVDPGHRTIQKLNDYRARSNGTCSLRMVTFSAVPLDEKRNSHWFFEIRETGAPDAVSVYYLGRKSDLVGLPVPRHFVGDEHRFRAPDGRRAKDLEGRGHYTTLRTWNPGSGSAAVATYSRLYLGPFPQVLNIPMIADIPLPPPKVDPVTGAENVLAKRSREGDFIRVR